VQFGLLGELVVKGDRGTLAVGGPRQRALLALLLLNANRTVPADRLLDELWRDRAADASSQALLMAVSRLRHAMVEDPSDRDRRPTAVAERITTREHGYLLRIEAGELDSVEFERELAAGRAALVQGEPAIALAQLSSALGRWRGDALDEFRDHPWARLDALRLEALKVEALEERIAAELSLGNHGAVVGELERLIAVHPERERLHEQLMIALYRCGRQVDALTAFLQAREYLVSEYGVEPGQSLRDLHQAILAHDPALAIPRDVVTSGAGQSAVSSLFDRFPALTSRLRVASEFAFVGRASECAALEEVLADEGRSVRAVLVSGEPGIGKTRLVSEFATRAHERGIAVVGGRCDSDLGLPYQPFVEVLGDLLASAPSTVIERHLRVHGLVLARIVPRLSLGQPVSQTKPAHDGEGAHYRLFVAVADLLAQLATGGHLVVVLEDLHWADEPTILLLKHVLTMPNVESLTFLGTYRSTEVEDSPLNVLLPELHRERGVRRLALDGLSDADVIELVQSQQEQSLDAPGRDVARRLRRDTAGNPFFLLQLLQSQGDVGRAAGVRANPEGTPEMFPVSLRETINARVAGLGAQTARLIRAAAVVGDEFDLALLRKLAPDPEEEVLSSIEAAISARLLLEVPRAGSRLAFVHTLVPDVLRSELSAPRLRTLHRDVAQAMERLYGQTGGEHVAALAYHWRQGCDPPATEPALRAARLAAERALDRLAPAEAVRWYHDAVELQSQQADPAPAERCELLIGLGQAQRQAGDAGFRDTLLAAALLAKRLEDSDQLVRATLANTRGFTSATGEIDTERVEMLRTALQHIDSTDSPERARLLAAQAVELAFCGERDTPRRLSDEALAMARRGADDVALTQVLTTRFFAIWTPDTLAARLAESAENVRVCERLGDPLAQSQALHWRAAACLEACDMADATQCIKRAGELSDRLREPTVMWLTAWDHASLALAVGHLDRGEQLALRALELGQLSGQPDALPVFAAQLTNLRFDQGRLGELVPLIEQVLTDHPGITGFRAVLALARCEEQEHTLARQAMALDASCGFAEVAYDVTWLSVTCIYAHVAARLGELDAARTLYAILEPWHDQVAMSVVAWGSVAHYLGMLATVLEDFSAAGNHLEHAAQVHEQMGTPVWAAQTNLAMARMLAARRRRGDKVRSKHLAERALRAARDLGCGAIARDADALLDSLSKRT
jgi:DNA-binding SARP family transcriptional activator